MPTLLTFARGLRNTIGALTLVAATLSIAAPTASASHIDHGSRRARAAQSCANADTPALHSSSKVIRAAVLCLINQQRVSRRLPALHEQSRLDRSAQGWTNEMIQQGAFSHGSGFAARITAAGFTWSAAGENIATGFNTPRAVVTGWMGSAGHCSNILDPSFSDVGTGVGRSAAGRFPAGSVWTQDFALRMGEPTPSANWGPANGCPYAT
jgi:uncharacterized protein YkwD